MFLGFNNNIVIMKKFVYLENEKTDGMMMAYNGLK